MSDDIVIRAEGVSKKFSRNLKHVMLYGAQDITKNMFGLSSNSGKLRNGEFWAVNDVSFEVKRGETFGIIGTNGSGKTTLLKMLNGIFMPDKGQIKIKGRVGALIEVGAGFHQMLTGRENIYINGAILGMSKKDVDKRFDEIVDFADIGDFIDSPVKHYSSGMYVRLGFAVAVHCEPDILLIDEVLAVGDANFQNKCFRKLTQFKNAGKTIILVTHDMDAIARHCDSAIVISSGNLLKMGEPREVVTYYLDILEGRYPNSKKAITKQTPKMEESTTVSKDISSEIERFLNELPERDNCVNRKNYNKNECRQGYRKAEMVDYLMICGNDYNPLSVYSGDMVDFYIKARFHDNVKYPIFGFAVKTINGMVVYGFHSGHSNIYVEPAVKSDYKIFKLSIKLSLAPGDYFLDMGTAEKNEEGVVKSLDRRVGVIHLKILAKREFNGLVNLEPFNLEIINALKENCT